MTEGSWLVWLPLILYPPSIFSSSLSHSHQAPAVDKKPTACRDHNCWWSHHCTFLFLVFDHLSPWVEMLASTIPKALGVPFFPVAIHSTASLSCSSGRTALCSRALTYGILPYTWRRWPLLARVLHPSRLPGALNSTISNHKAVCSYQWKQCLGTCTEVLCKWLLET